MSRVQEEYVLVLTNMPDRDGALALANALTSERLAACVNIMGNCTSVYRWKGAVECAEEVPVFIKTRAALYPQLEAAVRRLHPYEVPEIIALQFDRALPEFQSWLREALEDRK